jgi:hypothetical protein
MDPFKDALETCSGVRAGINGIASQAGAEVKVPGAPIRQAA